MAALAPMTRLQLAKRLRQEAGIAGNGPTTTVGLSGELARLVDWLDAAWTEIQGLQLWDWQWELVTLAVPEGASSVPGAVPANRWLQQTMRCNGAPLVYLPWREFADAYPDPGQGLPDVWTVRPDLAVAVNRVAPLGGLTLKGERYARPTAMTADTDVPTMPAEYHLAVMWLALQKYASFEEAGTLYQTAEREYRKLLLQMRSASTPDVTLGAALC